MIGRRQLTVASPIAPSAIGRALVESLQKPELVQSRAVELTKAAFGARAALLCDTGTSALVLALRLAAPQGGVVGLPGYACVDLVAAALYAGLRVRLYDIDASTLSPDLESVAQMLTRGVDVIVVAHLFGYPADVASVREIAGAAGVRVIEDAAQGAGGTLNGKRLGSLGDVAILSFGRGKGLSAAGGGALLAFTDEWAGRLETLELPSPNRGISGLGKSAIQFVLGRPSVYALPAMIPWLHLGETVFHAATEPRAMSRASCSMLRSALALEPSDLAGRRSRASALAATDGRELAPIAAIPGGNPGYLRYAIRDASNSRRAESALGIVNPYRVPIAEQPSVLPILMNAERATPASVELSRALFTLPTHRFVGDSDLARLRRWIEGRERAG